MDIFFGDERFKFIWQQGIVHGFFSDGTFQFSFFRSLALNELDVLFDDGIEVLRVEGFETPYRELELTHFGFDLSAGHIGRGCGRFLDLPGLLGELAVGHVFWAHLDDVGVIALGFVDDIADHFGEFVGGHGFGATPAVGVLVGRSAVFFEDKSHDKG